MFKRRLIEVLLSWATRLLSSISAKQLARLHGHLTALDKATERPYQLNAITGGNVMPVPGVTFRNEPVYCFASAADIPPERITMFTQLYNEYQMGISASEIEQNFIPAWETCLKEGDMNKAYWVLEVFRRWLAEAREPLSVMRLASMVMFTESEDVRVFDVDVMKAKVAEWIGTVQTDSFFLPKLWRSLQGLLGISVENTPTYLQELQETLLAETVAVGVLKDTISQISGRTWYTDTAIMSRPSPETTPKK